MAVSYTHLDVYKRQGFYDGGGRPMRRDAWFELLRTGMAITVALIIGFIVTSMVSKSPLEAFGYFLKGPFTTIRRFGAFLEAAIPLTFTGLAITPVSYTHLDVYKRQGQL